MANLFELTTTDLSSEFFEVLAQGESVKIERIVSKGHRSPETGWYDQAHHEWVAVLKGQAIIEIDNQTSVTLKPGDHLIITPHQKHRVAWTEPGIETLWLAVHYTN